MIGDRDDRNFVLIRLYAVPEGPVSRSERRFSPWMRNLSGKSPERN